MKISWQSSIDLETQVQQIIFNQIDRGVNFDSKLAEKHLIELDYRKNKLYDEIRPLLDMELIIKETKFSEDKVISDQQFKKGDYNYVKKLYTANGSPTASLANHYGDNLDIVGGPFSRLEWEEPSLSKRARLAKQLIRKGWKPESKTEAGSPQLTIDGKPAPSLSKFGELGKYLSDWFTYNHRNSQITGMLGHVRDDGRVEARGDALGTNTARMRHSGAVCNVPKADPKILFGKEMREVFIASDGYDIAGVDSSGLEGRIAAHYTWPYDDGEFARELLEGDIHTKNANHFGIDRNHAKTIYYGLTNWPM